MADEPSLSECQIRRVQAWRRGVVGLWIATMVAALAVWVIVSALSARFVVELTLVALPVGFAALATWNMRRGRCPHCGQRIQFEPRIELPRACPHCTASSLPTCDRQQ
jgi:Flp pilus assembly protein TadB